MQKVGRSKEICDHTAKTTHIHSLSSEGHYSHFTVTEVLRSPLNKNRSDDSHRKGDHLQVT